MMKAERFRSSARALAAALAAGVLMGQGTCLAGRQFREAALPSLESGVNLILDGFVEGLFAAAAVEAPSASDDGSARSR